MDKSLLLPREKYAEVAQKYGEASIMFEIENDKQSLFYFGANHSLNPDNPQYQALREYWDRFLDTTKGKDRIVLIESGLRKVRENEETAIMAGSEGSLITLFAYRENISVASPDIGDSDLMDLLPNLNKEEFLLYLFLVQLNHSQRISPRPPFEKDFQFWCENTKQRKLWQDTDISLPILKELYKKILGKEFDEDDDTNHLINPNRNETPINKFARARSDLRDLNIASEIERYWKEGKSIFAVFGMGHLIIEEPALRKTLI